MPSTPLSPLLREAMQRIRALLRSNDTPTIKQALELIFSLDDPELYAALLRGAGTVVEDGQLPQLRLSGPFSAQGRDARRMRWALLRVLRAAPTQPFCQTATALHLDSPVLDTEDLVFPALETLSLWRVRRWQNAGHLETMEHLRDLRLHTCARPADLALPTGLQTLRIDGDHTLPDLSLTARLNALSRLELLQVDALARLDGVPASVSTLHILRAASLSDVSALSGCPRLEDVNLSGCVRLGSLDGMQPGRLRVLRINQAPRLASLRALRGCVALEELELSGCGSLPSLEGVEDAAGLRALVLHDLAALATLDAVQHADLVRLDIQNCPRLASLSGLAGSHSLKALNAAGLAVEGLDGLAGLRGLRRLALRACGRLADVSGLADLAGLEVLSLSGCPTLADLSGLPPLRALTLDAVAATDLSTLPELGVLVWRGPATQALLESVPSHVLRLRLQRAVVDPADVPAALADRIRWVV